MSGAGGKGLGVKGGHWKFPKLGSTYRWLSVGGDGCGGGAMMGVRRVMGKSGGKRL